MVREANIYDINYINDLGLKLNNKFIKLFNMKEILKEEISTVYVYEDKNEIKGFLHITKLYEIIDIVNIVVDENVRNKGIGTILLDYLFSGLNKDIKLITLEVAVDNKPAIALYKKFGFQIYNERKHYYRNKNAYVMGRRFE